MSKSKQGQCCQGKIDDPQTGGMRTPPSLGQSLPPVASRFFCSRLVGERFLGIAGRWFLVSIIQSQVAQQTFASCIHVFVDPRAVPGQLVS